MPSNSNSTTPILDLPPDSSTTTSILLLPPSYSPTIPILLLPPSSYSLTPIPALPSNSYPTTLILPLLSNSSPATPTQPSSPKPPAHSRSRSKRLAVQHGQIENKHAVMLSVACGVLSIRVVLGVSCILSPRPSAYRNGVGLNPAAPEPAFDLLWRQLPEYVQPFIHV